LEPGRELGADLSPFSFGAIDGHSLVVLAGLGIDLIDVHLFDLVVPGAIRSRCLCVCTVTIHLSYNRRSVIHFEHLIFVELSALVLPACIVAAQLSLIPVALI
jgi:hypothetical protein